MSQERVIVVGGGLAGLAASVRIAEAGVPVDLFSMVPVKRSHSVCAQGGINACNEVARQQGYSDRLALISRGSRPTASTSSRVMVTPI